MVNMPAGGCAPMVPGCSQAQTVGSYVPGYLNHDYGAEVRMGCAYSTLGCRVDGVGEAFTVVDGLSSNKLTVRWNASAVAYYTSECWPGPPRVVYDVDGSATLTTTIELQVNTVPAGQPVTIYYAWWSLIHCLPRPEAGAEDDATARVSLRVLGQELIPARFRNLAGIWALVLLPPPTAPAGAIYAHGGDIITIDISADVSANIAEPLQVLVPAFDEARAEYNGELVLSIDSPVTVLNPATAPDGFASFSVDLGSDTEMSDPDPNGNEVFDPGDLYPWNGPLLPPGGASGPRDDVEIFLTDYWPTAPDGPPPTTGAETCAGKTPSQIQGILGARFDLDGTDQLDFSLIGVIPPNQPLSTPLPQFDTHCVYNADHLVVSFNDDGASHYAGPGCDVPVGSPSPAGHTYGTHLERDELVGVDVSVSWPLGPAGPPAVVDGTYPIMDEAGLHPNLAPDPDGQERDDDDIDAVDIGVGACTVWYFSTDHEATGIAPFPPPQLLDPGAIYQVLGPPSYGAQKVIDPQVHLGLAAGTDVDAFEFAWLPPCDTCPPALALLFSVAPDDYLTPSVDESGGLDPQMIYYSFFNGSSYALLDQPLADDVDAIATTPMPFLPQSCTSSGTVAWSDDFESYPASGGIAGGGGWETWANDPTIDGLISPQFALSGSQSLEVGPSTDVVHQFAAVGGRWEITGRVYVPFGTTGQSYFILLNDYNSSGTMPPESWSVQTKIDADNLAVRDDFGGQAVPLYTNTWMSIHVEIDLVNDDAWIYFDGKLLDRRPWTRGAGGALQLAAVDLFTQNSPVFFDDFVLTGIDDCNGNGIDDLCDIATGTSQDCNQNGIPDECDIAGGVSIDANGNGIPDECEFARGDLNCDGRVDNFDITPFVALLTGP